MIRVLGMSLTDEDNGISLKIFIEELFYTYGPFI